MNSIFDDDTTQQCGRLILESEVLFQQIQALQKKYDETMNQLRKELRLATDFTSKGISQ